MLKVPPGNCLLRPSLSSQRLGPHFCATPLLPNPRYILYAFAVQLELIVFSSLRFSFRSEPIVTFLTIT